MLLAVVCVFPGCNRVTHHDLVDAANEKFHIGDSWQYQTRPGEEQSKLTVVKLESNSRLGIVVHISLAGLRIKNPHVDGGVSETIAHMPFALSAVETSVTTLLTRNARLPSFESGHQQWREAFTQGKAGVFTASVRDAIDGVEKGMNQ